MSKAKVTSGQHETKQLVKRLQKEGWTVQWGGKHLRAYPPGWQPGDCRPCGIPTTPPKGRRSWQNTQADLKRAKKQVDLKRLERGEKI